MKAWNVLSLFFLLTFFSACTEEDPCLSMHCNNNGQCIDGTCACDPGWAGDNCGKVNIPDTIYLKKLVFSNIPLERDNGAPLDPEDGPDLYLDLYLAATTAQESVHPDFYPNAEPDGTYAFEFPGGYALPHPGVLYFSLNDRDGGETDENQYDDHVPSTITAISPLGLLYNHGVREEYVFDLVTTIIIDNETGETRFQKQATVTAYVEWGI